MHKIRSIFPVLFCLFSGLSFAGPKEEPKTLRDLIIIDVGLEELLKLDSEAMNNTAALVSSLKSVVIGQHHSCAILEDDEVFCWGMNLAQEAALPILAVNRTTQSEMPHLSAAQGQLLTDSLPGHGSK